MYSRRIKALTVIAGLAAIGALGGNATRGAEDVELASGAPAVTITRTPYAAPPSPTPAAVTRAAEQDAAAAARKAAEAKKASDAKAASAAAAKAAAAKWTVTKVVDGDTIWVARSGVSYKVRFIGIDTPEVGQCGFTEARNALRGIIGGQAVTLTAGAQDDVDRYGRLLRYIDVNGVDAGLRQVKRGFAIARYDSRDGYGRHTRETAYVQADRSSPKAPCAAPTTGGASGSSASPGSSGGSAGTSGGSTLTGTWPLAGDRYPCPQARPVKGNESSMIAHEPGDRYYNVTKPEQCFPSMGAAEAAGFRPAKV